MSLIIKYWCRLALVKKTTSTVDWQRRGNTLYAG